MKDTEANKIKKRKVKLGPGNFVSQLFFFWVFMIILVIRRAKEIKDVCLILRKRETCQFNDEKLERKWEQEKKQALKENRYREHDY